MIKNTLSNRQPLTPPVTPLPKNTTSEQNASQGVASSNSSLSIPSLLNVQAQGEIRQAPSLLFMGQACPTNYDQGSLAKKVRKFLQQETLG